MKTQCTHCQQLIETTADTNGMEMECPTCKKKFIILPTGIVINKSRSKKVIFYTTFILLSLGILGGIGYFICEEDITKANESLEKSISADKKLAKKYSAPKNNFTNSELEVFQLPKGVRLEMVQLPEGWYMGKFEVTQAQWNALMEKKFRWYCENCNKKIIEIVGEGPDYPMYYVNWTDINEFCNKLNDAGYAPSGWKFTIPTRKQWTYACQAGTTTNFSYGDASDSNKMNFNGNYPYGGGSIGVYRKETVTVGSLGYENTYGLSDMHGNVSELCGESIDDLEIRGGSWCSSANECRSLMIGRWAPDLRSSSVGFRIALVPFEKKRVSKDNTSQ